VPEIFPVAPPPLLSELPQAETPTVRAAMQIAVTNQRPLKVFPSFWFRDRRIVLPER
jgi:hypothetical protein